MTRRPTAMEAALVGGSLVLMALLPALLPAGCATTTRIGPELGTPRPGDGLGDVPALATTSAQQEAIAEQVGLLNAAVQGITGISIHQAIPLGLVVLVACMMVADFGRSWLSHRREVMRIRCPGHRRNEDATIRGRSPLP